MVPAAGGETACAGTGGIVPTFRIVQTIEDSKSPEARISCPTLRWRPPPVDSRSSARRGRVGGRRRVRCARCAHRGATGGGRNAVAGVAAQGVVLAPEAVRPFRADIVCGPRTLRPCRAGGGLRQSGSGRGHAGRDGRIRPRPRAIRPADRLFPGGRTRLRRDARGPHRRAPAGIGRPGRPDGQCVFTAISNVPRSTVRCSALPEITAANSPTALAGSGPFRRGPRGSDRGRGGRRPPGVPSRRCSVHRSAGRYWPR